MNVLKKHAMKFKARDSYNTCRINKLRMIVGNIFHSKKSKFIT